MAMPVDTDGKEGKLLSVSDMLASGERRVDFWSEIIAAGGGGGEGGGQSLQKKKKNPFTKVGEDKHHTNSNNFHKTPTCNFCFKSPKGAQRLAGNGFSIGGSGLLEPLRCLVRGREDPLKAKASPPLFGYSREVGHSPDMIQPLPRSTGHAISVLFETSLAISSDQCRKQKEVSCQSRRREHRRQLELKDNDENRVSFGGGGGGGGRATKRVSRNRSLSTRLRGRISIAVAACVDNQPRQKQARKKRKTTRSKSYLHYYFAEKQHNISIFRKKSNTLKRLMLLRCWKRARLRKALVHGPQIMKLMRLLYHICHQEKRIGFIAKKFN
ncbi:hypothetical protein NC653_030225 [Populus alba x Populus x berolinensis]|uniref:Uncharacterized protein n=1 Tax=Populus alba x Populus x berolinensis TaxID=444605 RepID=A0AAD6Q1U3_9ROSI|nr:hypothetical protein NC653_030225 [Populus alba x Populus x berolinensis]